MKGIVIFYINYHPEKGEKVEDYVVVIKNENKTMLESLASFGYEVAFVPVTNESSRVEKFEFSTEIKNTEILNEVQ